MRTLLEAFYERMGIDYVASDTTPMLIIDESLTCCFVEREGGLRMVCPLGPLDAEPALLAAMLCANFEEGGRVMLAASEDTHCLLACLDVRLEEGLDGLQAGFETLLGQVWHWRERLEGGAPSFHFHHALRQRLE